MPTDSGTGAANAMELDKSEYLLDNQAEQPWVKPDLRKESIGRCTLKDHKYKNHPGSIAQ
jgi:hypothetical protein